MLVGSLIDISVTYREVVGEPRSAARLEPTNHGWNIRKLQASRRGAMVARRFPMNFIGEGCEFDPRRRYIFIQVDFKYYCELCWRIRKEITLVPRKQFLHGCSS